MKYLPLIIVFLSTYVFAKNQVFLSSDIYQQVPYTNIYMEDGALVQNIPFLAVKKLIPQLEKIYNISLEDRGEAHITVITPPDFDGRFNDGKVGLHNIYTPEEIHSKYKDSIQQYNFNVVCIGKRESSKGNLVFFIVVETDGLFGLRNDLSNDYENKALSKGINSNFAPNEFWPHITIGYVKGDVHGVTKGRETCIDDIEIIFY